MGLGAGVESESVAAVLLLLVLEERGEVLVKDAGQQDRVGHAAGLDVLLQDSQQLFRV